MVTTTYNFDGEEPRNLNLRVYGPKDESYKSCVCALLTFIVLCVIIIVVASSFKKEIRNDYYGTENVGGVPKNQNRNLFEKIKESTTARSLNSTINFDSIEIINEELTSSESTTATTTRAESSTSNSTTAETKTEKITTEPSSSVSTSTKSSSSISTTVETPTSTEAKATEPFITETTSTGSSTSISTTAETINSTEAKITESTSTSISTPLSTTVETIRSTEAKTTEPSITESTSSSSSTSISTTVESTSSTEAKTTEPSSTTPTSTSSSTSISTTVEIAASTEANIAEPSITDSTSSSSSTSTEAKKTEPSITAPTSTSSSTSISTTVETAASTEAKIAEPSVTDSTSSSSSTSIPATTETTTSTEVKTTEPSITTPTCTSSSTSITTTVETAASTEAKIAEPHITDSTSSSSLTSISTTVETTSSTEAKTTEPSITESTTSSSLTSISTTVETTSSTEAKTTEPSITESTTSRSSTSIPTTVATTSSTEVKTTEPSITAPTSTSSSTYISTSVETAASTEAKIAEPHITDSTSSSSSTSISTTVETTSSTEAKTTEPSIKESTTSSSSTSISTTVETTSSTEAKTTEPSITESTTSSSSTSIPTTVETTSSTEVKTTEPSITAPTSTRSSTSISTTVETAASTEAKIAEPSITDSTTSSSSTSIISTTVETTSSTEAKTTQPSITESTSTSSSTSISTTVETTTSTPESTPKIKNNICDTQSCKKTSAKLYSNINLDVKPCENFYDYVCGDSFYDEASREERRMKNRIRELIYRRSDVTEVNLFQGFYKSCVGYQPSTMNNNLDKKIVEKNIDKFANNDTSDVSRPNHVDALIAELILNNTAPLFDVSLGEGEGGISVFKFTPPKLPQPNPGSLLNCKIIAENLIRNPSSASIDLNEINEQFESCKMEAAITDSVDNLKVALTSVNVTFGNVEMHKRSEYIDEILSSFRSLIEIRPKWSTTKYDVYKIETLQNHTKINLTFFLQQLTENRRQIPNTTVIQIYNSTYFELLFEKFSVFGDKVNHNLLLGTYLTDLYFEFISPKLGPSREDYCLENAMQFYPETVSNLYFNDLGTEKQKIIKTKTREVFNNLTGTFKEIINRLDLDAREKTAIEEKLSGLQLHFYDKVIPVSIESDISANTSFAVYWINSVRSLKKRQFSYWNQSFIPSLWTTIAKAFGSDPISVYSANAIVIPYGIFPTGLNMTEAFTSTTFSKIGFKLAHHIAGLFNTMGNNNSLPKDLQENYDNVVENCTFEKYKDRRSIKIENQILRYHANISRVYNEKVNDDSAISLCYEALFKNNTLITEEKSLPWIGESYNQKKLFYIATVQDFCNQEENDIFTFMGKLFADSSTSPARLRVESFLSNDPTFSTVFNCPMGHGLNSELKCNIFTDILHDSEEPSPDTASDEVMSDTAPDDVPST